MTSKVLVVTKSEDVPLKAIDNKPTIVYWDLVGLVQPIRLALVYAGVEHTDVRIFAGYPTDPTFAQAWKVTKEKMTTDNIVPFPNLPYYMDEDVKLSQTHTILQYIGRKYNLMGDPGKEYKMDIILDECKDIESSLATNCYRVGKEGLVDYLTTTLIPIKLKQFNSFLSDGDGPYVTGNQISIADMKLFVLLLKIETMTTDLEIPTTWVQDSPSLASFFSHMKEIPAFQSYMSSPNYQERPLNNTVALVVFAPKENK